MNEKAPNCIDLQWYHSMVLHIVLGSRNVETCIEETENGTEFLQKKALLRQSTVFEKVAKDQISIAFSKL